MKQFVRQFVTLFQNELLLTTRNKESFLSLVFFCFLVILVFDLGFSFQTAMILPLVFPFVWLATLFGGILRMNRTFEPEGSGEVFSGLRVIPKIAVPYFLSKFIINFFFILLIEVIVLFLVIFLFNVAQPVVYLKNGVIPFVLGAFGFACVGTVFSSMLITHKRKDLILPVILYPILVPIIVGVIKSFTYSVQGDLIGLEITWIKILGIFDIVYFVLSLLVFETLMEA